jgi:hypothetical protein
MSTDLDQLCYPIGRFQAPADIEDPQIQAWIENIEALPEDCPEIKAYFEERWAELGDYSSVPVSVSLALLKSLHQRWVGLLRSLGPEDLKWEWIHPDTGSTTNLVENIGAYAWHGRHHLAHIEQTVHREGWVSD